MSEATTPITVLMSVYNGEKFLQAAIDSILAQTFSDFEFLIIDDGSTDNSVSIIQTYQDHRIRLVLNDVNKGLTPTLNIGLGLAKGRYIARMDADDIAHPSRLQRQYEYLQSHPKTVLVGTNSDIINLDGKVTGHWSFPQKDEELRVWLLFRSVFVHSAAMFKKEVILPDGYDTSFATAQDYGLWVNLAKKGKIANLPQTLLQYRKHGNAISTRSLHNQLDVTRTLQMRQLADWGIVPNEQEQELQLILGLTMSGFWVNAQVIQDAYRWLEQLIIHNEKMGTFSREVFEGVARNVWLGLFNRKQSILTPRSGWPFLFHPFASGLYAKWMILLHSTKGIFQPFIKQKNQ
ncbi:MAG: glycosyltransferase [Saprospiraceae bacterium]